jgi:D-arabinose 1-dehydrogenase-like Zn-dependent alcohol dehydrogenase
MKQYIAVVSSEAGKIAKYQDFDTQAESDAHVVTYGGFAIAKPSDNIKYWIVGTGTLAHDTAQEAADADAVVANQYAVERQKNIADGGYGTQSEQFEILGEQGIGPYQAHIAAVKAAHPKPGA